MTSFENWFRLDLTKWRLLVEEKGRNSVLDVAKVEGKVKADLASLVIPPDAVKLKISQQLGMEVAVADKLKPLKPPFPKKQLPSDDFEEKEMGQDLSDKVDGVMVALLSVEDPQTLPLYAQAQTAVVSDAPTGVAVSYKVQSMAAAAQEPTAMPGWADVFMAIDKIPVAGVLGGVAAAGALGGTSGSAAAPASDIVPPTLAVTSDKSFLSKGQTAKITFTLSEASTNFTLDDVVVSGGTLSNFSGSGATYTATFTPTANSITAGSVSVASGKFSDAAGNVNDDGSETNNTASLAIDTVAPSIAVTSDKSNLNANQTATITFTLSDAATDFDASDVQVSGGTLSNFSGSGTTYSATFTPAASSTTAGAVSVASGKFSNAAGNQNTDGSDTNNTLSLTVDTIAPTVAVTSDMGSLSKGQTARVTFTLSEPATDFAQADVAVSGGTLSNFSGSGTTYTATFTPAVNSSAAGAVSVASGKFSDAVGNQNADGGDVNNLVTMTVDTVSPVMPIARLDGSWTANPQVTMSIDLGSGSAQDVVVEVYPNAAPVTAANWLAYVNTGYYSDLIFHRVIAGFMVQAGAFTSDLVQHAATYAPIALETTQASGLSNLTGTLAMARTSVADSATSQFFISVADNTFLDYSSASSPGYAVFGKVVSGMSTVNSIANVATGTVNGMANVPNSAVILNNVSETSTGTAYSSSGKIYLSALEQGAHYSYSLDGGAWTSMSTSQTLIDLGSTLSTGVHGVQVRQIDSAGNASASATVQFTQYVPDYVHSVLDLATVSDTSGGADGTATDNITQSTNLSLTAVLNALSGQTVWLMDQGRKVASAVADSSGHLTWQVSGASLGDHIYTLYDPVHQVRIADGDIASSELLVRVI